MPPTNTNPPQTRCVRTFASAQEAVDFIAHCLETGNAIRLLSEIQGIGQQVGRVPALVDRYKTVFQQMQAIHRSQNLRQLYAESHFPTGGSEYQLGGYLAQQADFAVRFVHLPQGWVLESIDYL